MFFLKYASCAEVGRWSVIPQCVLSCLVFAGAPVETSPEEQMASCEGDWFCALTVCNTAPLNVIFLKYC